MASFISNLKFAHKFVLIGLLALLMLAVPSTMVVTANLSQLETIRQEVAGIEPAGDVLRLIQLTQQHRGLSAVFLGGNEAIAATRQTKQAEVERALAQSLASIAALEDAKLSAETRRLTGIFKSLAEGVGNKSLAAPQSFAQHTGLIAAEIALLDDIANASGIVLHPEPGGYFLQLGVLTHLPRLTEALGQLRARGAVLLARGEASAEDRARVEALLALARRHELDARKALDLAGQSDAALQAAIASSFDKARAAADEGFKLVEEKILRADVLNFPSSEYFAATTRVIDAQFALVDAAFKALHQELQKNLDRVRTQLMVVLGTIVVLLALGVWITWTVIRTTTQSLGSALTLAQAVAAGDLTATVRPGGRDEVGQLLKALGEMNTGLAKVVSSVRLGSESVSTASAEIAQGNQDLSARTESQASALEETAASMEELGSTVKQNA
ncbi:MAG: nitrate- and nitrite sensing domain-containing protein, partial [Hylemonella sp.]|uniref:methyl-accepting chemotaxis protein n=1 Tax=Hylemonella sp. TaxID=2066020 RepID=UPI0022C4EC7C